LDRFIKALRKAKDDQKFTHSLPVFYVNLDPAGIPADDNLDTEAVTRVPA
jgi:hypothetical protein